MAPAPSIREVLSALEWVRGEMMRRGSPDFIRQREAETRVRRLCQQLLRTCSAPSASSTASGARRISVPLHGSGQR